MENEKELLSHVQRMDFETNEGVFCIIKYKSEGAKNWTVCNSNGYMRKTDYVNNNKVVMIPKELISNEELASDDYMLSFDEALDVVIRILNNHKIN